TVTCQDADAVFLDVELRQSVGRFTISGYGSTAAACDGTAQPWSAEVLPSNGKFAGGRTVSVVVGFACGPFSCGESSQEARVKLRGR
ncbi:MAG TPA: hypothetical protein VLA98_05060, partial [Solirubrobacteraceae bacterium]|nr:hypothetical protein [Solirubrobacteraceae bacterium]